MLPQKNGDSESSLISGILNALDCHVIVVRGKDCGILFMNASAREFFKEKKSDCASCRTGYGSLYAGACEKCPNQKANISSATAFDVDGVFYSFTANTITWMDEKPAVLITVRQSLGATIDRQLYNYAYLDSLTGVPNRLRLREDFKISVSEENATGMCGAVALMDLDNFKAVNDTYGHNTGDIMLKRFADHIQANPDYAGHFYRLGGDEFVLFYSQKQDASNTVEHLRKFYSELFAGAFYSYTMPGINLACTISMGVSLFPEYGITFSELLRKADIALYKAKGEGRNKMEFFSDQKEEAKKFDDFYINIRPILSDYGKTFGYELIDSDSKNKTEPNELSLNFNEYNRTIDSLSLCDLESDARYFIAYSYQLSSKVVTQNFPKDKFIIRIQLPETYTQKDLDVYRSLRSQGYSLALVGFGGTHLHRELLQIFDYFTFKPSMVSIMQKKIIDANPGKIFIASNVDTTEVFDSAKKLGFKLFQGQFFNQPIVAKKEKSIDPLRLNYLRLLRLTGTGGQMDFPQIAKIISDDLALSYKLLRLLNSAAIGLRYRISSISMAISYLGEDKLKKWIALLALRGVASDKPLELVRVSLIRARFGELLAPHINPAFSSDQVFLFGMLSLLHIMLDKSQEDMLNEIQVADEIQRSLLTAHGEYSSLLSFFKNYECANWDGVTAFAEENGLSNELIYDSYIDSINWYNSLIDSETANPEP